MIILILISFLVFDSRYFNSLNLFIFQIEGVFNFSLYGICIDVCIHSCRLGNRNFDVLFRRNTSINFLLKDTKDASYEEEKYWKWFLFDRQIRCFLFDIHS